MTTVEERLRVELASIPDVDAPVLLVDRALARARRLRLRRRLGAGAIVVVGALAGAGFMVSAADDHKAISVTSKPPDAVTGERIDIGFAARQLVVGQGAIWAADPYALVMVDTATATTRRFSNVTRQGIGLAVSRHAVWMLESTRVVKFDIPTQRVTATIGIPNGLAIAAGDDDVWVVTNSAAIRIDPRTNRVVNQVAVPTGTPTRAVVSPGALWILMPGGRLVRVDRDLNRAENLDFSSDVSGIAWGTGALWGISSSGLMRVDGTTLEVRRSLASTGWSLTTGAGRIWITRPAGPNGIEVSIVDATTERLVSPSHLIHERYDAIATAANDALWLASGGELIRLPVP